MGRSFFYRNGEKILITAISPSRKGEVFRNHRGRTVFPKGGEGPLIQRIFSNINGIIVS